MALCADVCVTSGKHRIHFFFKETLKNGGSDELQLYVSQEKLVVKQLDEVQCAACRYMKWPEVDLENCEKSRVCGARLQMQFCLVLQSYCNCRMTHACCHRDLKDRTA